MMNTSCDHTVRRVLWCLLLATFAGCGSQPGTPDTKVAPEDALHTEVERGPVKATVDVVPKEPRLSDEPVLTLTIMSEHDVDVTPPPFGSALGEFIIRDFHEPLPAITDGRQMNRQIYHLEPTRAGFLTIDPITIRFVDNRPQADGKEHVMETEAIRLEVATMIESEAPSLSNLRPAAPPVDLADDSTASLGMLLLGGLLAVVFVVFLLSRLRSRTETGPPPLSPQQLARRELDELIASRLSQTDVKEFFVALTGVVRRYIERSTGVRAPEQTTEEFLREVNGQKLFSEQENVRLEAFLESADLVKFAGYQPDPEAIQQSTHRASQFIELKAHAADLMEVEVGEPTDPTIAEASA